MDDAIGTVIGDEMQTPLLLLPFVELVDWITLWTFGLYAILDDNDVIICGGVDDVDKPFVSCTGALGIDDESFLKTIDM